jgi:hypothetical protein
VIVTANVGFEEAKLLTREELGKHALLNQIPNL